MRRPDDRQQQQLGETFARSVRTKAVSVRSMSKALSGARLAGEHKVWHIEVDLDRYFKWFDLYAYPCFYCCNYFAETFFHFTKKFCSSLAISTATSSATWTGRCCRTVHSARAAALRSRRRRSTTATALRCAHKTGAIQSSNVLMGDSLT
jgi:hypothetical protein